MSSTVQLVIIVVVSWFSSGFCIWQGYRMGRVRERSRVLNLCQQMQARKISPTLLTVARAIDDGLTELPD